MRLAEAVSIDPLLDAIESDRAAVRMAAVWGSAEIGTLPEVDPAELRAEIQQRGPYPGRGSSEAREFDDALARLDEISKSETTVVPSLTIEPGCAQHATR